MALCGACCSLAILFSKRTAAVLALLSPCASQAPQPTPLPLWHPPPLQDHCPIFKTGENRESVLKAAALAAKWKEPAKDALDTMVLGAADLDALEAFTMVDHQPFDPTIKRTESVSRGTLRRVLPPRIASFVSALQVLAEQRARLLGGGVP